MHLFDPATGENLTVQPVDEDLPSGGAKANGG